VLDRPSRRALTGLSGSRRAVGALDRARLERPVRACVRHVADCRQRAASFGAVEFTCPRCRTAVTDEFYGPCGTCRAELRAQFRGEGRVIELAEYEPKMNVTPNAVALKDD